MSRAFDIPSLLSLAFNAMFIGLLIWSLVWVYNDAEKRGKLGCLVTSLVLFVWPLGLLLWRIFRPAVSNPQSETSDPPHLLPELEIPLAMPEQQITLTSKALLLVAAQLSSLQSLYEKMGNPNATKKLSTGIALFYKSSLEKLPHVVLVNYQQGDVIFTAVSNHDGTISLQELESTYGNAELVSTINGYEYWFCGDSRISFCVEGRDKENIVYVQVLSKDMHLESYQSAYCYAQETFAFTN